MAEHRSVFDAHLHIIDPRYPLKPNKGYLPEPFDVAKYKARVSALDITSGAVVSGSFQAFDQSYLRAALARLGDQYVGVTQLPESVKDSEILDLHAAGVRALRFNLYRGGSASVVSLEKMAQRIYRLAEWHVELYAGFDALSELEPLLVKLPAVSIDHLGLEARGLPLLQRLAVAGVRIKATGFGRLDFDPFPAIQSLYEINPDCLMFGSDLPSTRAPRPFKDEDLMQLRDGLDPLAAERVLWSNARRFYGLDQ